ncbi:cell surface protein [Streptomyces sp. HNM0575]|uniref:IPT/TIG domain-containing protein n=1 Tax=Streptomyces sp. HNM0575 TaxID=2716338 RepID=UPI00145EF980|nr:IPT/TIG domain-containing protein [Streptomyces sp. HNM0575]NLU75293.1 cell surface protein [Streptomyces sp. HNM0575]
MPTITSLSTTQGKGGDPLSITGSGFGTGTVNVSVGNKTVAGTAAGTTVSTTVPSACAGQVNVTVTAAGSISNGKAFFYVAVPECTGLSVTTGPEADAPNTTITGSGLASATAVAFGGTAGTVVSHNGDFGLTVTPPDNPVTGAPVTVDVTITSPGGTSTPSGASSQYTYYDTPTVSSVSPGTGTAGEEGVLVTGTGLYDVTGVTFTDPTTTTDYPVSDFAGLSDTQVLVTTPATLPAATAFDVTITNPGGTTAVNPAATFTTT